MRYQTSRPTETAKGTTHYHNENGEYEKKKYVARLHCLICGFLNKEHVSKCAVCESPNWKGDYGWLE